MSWAVYLDVSMNTCVDKITWTDPLSRVLSMKGRSMKVKTKGANSARVISERAINDTLAYSRDVLKGHQSGMSPMRREEDAIRGDPRTALGTAYIAKYTTQSSWSFLIMVIGSTEVLRCRCSR